MSKSKVLTIAEKFLLLTHHPQKERFIVDSHKRNIGLIGSILLDLSLEGVIEVESGKLFVKAPTTNLSSIHGLILNDLSKTKKPRPIKTWISKLSWYGRRNQREVLQILKRKGIVRIDIKHFLFIEFTRTKLINPKIRKDLLEEIRDVIFKSKGIDRDISVILGLIEACKMHKIVCKNQSEVKACKTKLKEIIKSDKISQNVEKVIREMQAAVMSAVIASSVVVTSGR